MRFVLPDEFQDGISAGSLAKARRCWIELSASGTALHPQLFTFIFRCPNERMALGLMDFLRYTPFAGFVRKTIRVADPLDDCWQVVGTTHGTVFSLASLEHLFMQLRGAGVRYESTLEDLQLLPMSQWPH